MDILLVIVINLKDFVYHVDINVMCYYLFSGYDEPSHHYVSVCYCNKYVFHSIVNKDASDEYKNIASLMKNLYGNDVKDHPVISHYLIVRITINEKLDYVFSLDMPY